MLKKLISAVLFPPFSNLILLLIAYIFLKRHQKMLAKYTALFSVLSLYLLSTPFFSNMLLTSLTEPSLPLADYQLAQAIVVLGGQSQSVVWQEGIIANEQNDGVYTLVSLPLHRVRHAAYLYHATGLAVLVSGGSVNGKISEAEIMAKELEKFYQIPVQWMEINSKDTTENAEFTRKLLTQTAESQNIHKIILITDVWHMKRAKIQFTQAGFEVLSAPVHIPDYLADGVFAFFPQARFLYSSQIALKEWSGILLSKVKSQ